MQAPAPLLSSPVEAKPKEPAEAKSPSLGERLVERTRVLLARHPMRLTGGPGEKGLQDECAAELARLGGVVEWQSFRWGRSIYASLALHFGLASAALVLAWWAPLAAAGLHLLIATSYCSESILKRPILRRMLSSVSSQNAIVVFASKRPMRHRIVTLAHADAAFTGVLFTPSVVRMAAKESHSFLGRAFRKGLALATFSIFALVLIELGMALLPGGRLWWIPAAVLIVPSFAAFVLNLDVVVRDQVVPAANDNLSGCVATLELAQRLVGKLPDDIELVTVITGSEEAGTGGAANLARRMREDGGWSTESTTVLALDTFSGGDPRLLQEGELIARPLPPRLVALTAAVCAAHPTLGPVPPYEIPSGATDAWPFLVAGYESLAITCIDASLGAPRNYHLPSDTAENLDADAFARTYRFTEQLIAALAKERSAVGTN